MTINIRRAPSGRQRAHRPCFLFGAKEASAGAEYRGIKQRFPYWCNETKTSRTARRRSPWIPRRRHLQSLWQAKTAFVRISCTSCSPSNLAVVGSLPAQYLGRGPRASINRASHRSRGQLVSNSFQFIHTPAKHENSSPQEAVLPLVLFILSPRGNPPPPHWSRVLHHNGGPNHYKPLSLMFLGFVELGRGIGERAN